MSDFVVRTAEAYANAPMKLAPWRAFMQDIYLASRDIQTRVIPTENVEFYSSVEHLREDISNGVLRVWNGGTFTGTGKDRHPALRQWPRWVDGLMTMVPGYMLSRLVHDYRAHYLDMESFDPHDELWAAYHGRLRYSDEAQDALYTDDVVMQCHFLHFGRFPDEQRPCIVEADWEGLHEYLTLTSKVREVRE